MKKPLLTILLAILLLVPGLEAQVDMDELSGVGPVEFINFEGPYSRIDTLAQIRDIGYTLGLAVNNGIERPGALNRYFVIVSRSDPDGSRLDADIFGLGVDTMIDHIRNLRLIMQGYLEGAYDYSASDAAILAQYVTVYNAVYRGALSFFDTRYRGPVMSHINQERAGLSLRFDEWPGQTLMLIPIGFGLGGPLSSIDTGSLMDPQVRDQLRQEPDGSIDLRRDMVDLLEREADQAGGIAAALRETAQEEAERIARERAAAELQEQLARQELFELGREDGDPDEIARREEEARRQLEEALRWQEELDDRQDFADELIREADRHDEFADERFDLAQAERREIATDQQALIDQPSRIQEPETIFGVVILNPDSSLGRLVRLDVNTGREIARSPLSTINARTIILQNNRLYAIAGENLGSSAVRLVEINPQNLQLIRQGDDDIAETSLLWQNGQNFFAIISSGTDFYLARFNQDLVLQARSAVMVHPHGTVIFMDDRITTQREDGSALLLNLTDLRVIME